MTEPLRVFIAEDDAIILMQLEMLLEEAGHNVVGTAMSASEVIQLTKEIEPEILLLDVQLKDGTSGLDVAHALNGYDDITIVFVTANPTKLGDNLYGAAAVIPKPFNEMLLAGSLAYLEQCVHRPPPRLQPPAGMRIAPAYLARMQNMR